MTTTRLGAEVCVRLAVGVLALVAASSGHAASPGIRFGLAFEPDSSFDATEGDEYSLQVEAVDGVGAPYALKAVRYACEACPPGMTIDSGTGLVEWTPAQDQVGEHEVSFVANAVTGASSHQNQTARIGAVLVVEAASDGPPPVDHGVVFATDFLTNTIVKFDADTGAQLARFGASESMTYPADMFVGPDGMLWVLDTTFGSAGGRVLRYEPSTNQFLGVFAYTSTSTGYDRGMAFGADGDLYVFTINSIMRHDGQTGQRLTDLASRPGSLSDMFAIATGPDDLLYVTGTSTSSNGGAIVRYEVDGTYLGVFATGGNGNGPRKPAWDAAGDLYSANLNDGTIRKYDGETGASLGIFSDPPSNGHVPAVFLPDGSLLTAGVWSQTIYRMNGTTGAFLSTFATGIGAENIAPW